ncbi:MAG: hypothetical protein JNG90_11810, partial [Planctomycetaceae bacterium]|nr:hypothetical protein [Planctomycetaceae bacterium]
DDAARSVRIERTYEPQPENRARYDQLFNAFVSSYKSNQRMFARLNAQ